jgi:hypothetical protein
MSRKNTYRPPVINRDHARPRTPPALSDTLVEARITALVSPLTYALVQQYYDLGLRTRVLTLPIMVGLVLALIWRQVASVSDLLRALVNEPLLWVPPLHVSQQAVSLRLRTLPAELFAAVFQALLPGLHERAAARSRRLPPVLARVQRHFPHIRVVDATTLEELFRKVGLLRDSPTVPLGGKVCGVLDLPSKLPVQVWLDPNPAANEKSFLGRIQEILAPGMLVLFDRGFYAFPFFDWLTEHTISFVTRARDVSAYEVSQWLVHSDQVRDAVITLGQYRSNPCQYPVRLVEVQIGGLWHRYLTNVLDPTVLSTKDVLDLYGYRWRIEDAFLLVKRLLGLAYLWTGAFNGIALQVWATWVLYAVLVDLGDAVAQELQQPLDKISLEMVYRGLYHFTVAHHQGRADDPVVYLARRPDLGVVKRRRKYREKERLDKLPSELNL